MNACVKYFDKNNQYLNLLIHNKELLKKYNEIWDNIKSLFKKDFDSQPLYNGKYIKTKISLNMYFCNNKMPRENERYVYLSVIILHYIINNK